MLASVLVLSAMLAELPDDSARSAGSIVDFGFEDRNRGWVLLCCWIDKPGRYELRRTFDGGETWSFVGFVPGPTSEDRTRATFADSENGWVYDDGLRATHDGGRKWSDELSGQVVDVVASGGTVWAMRVVKTPSYLPAVEILESPIGRSNWKPIPTQPGLRAGEHRSLVRRGQRVWLLENFADVGAEDFSRGRLLFSPDSGKSWTSLANPCPEDTHALRLTSVPSPGDGLALACGGEGEEVQGGARTAVFRSSDLGRSWKEVGTSKRRLSGYYFGHLSATSLDSSWLSGRDGPVAIGATGWTLLDSGAPNFEPRAVGSFGPIRFLGQQVGWIAYEEPGASYLLRTTDGGKTWRPLCLDQSEGFMRERSVRHTSGVTLTSLECSPLPAPGRPNFQCRGRLSAAPPRLVVVAVRQSYGSEPKLVDVEGETFAFDIDIAVPSDRDVTISVGFEGKETAGDCHVPVERSTHVVTRPPGSE